MKKLVFIATAFACLSVCMAQEAEPIESFIRTDHDAEWYARQRAAWQQKVDENPQDQWAWRNLFRATNYHEMFTTGPSDPDHSPSAQCIRRMEAAIPDSYALHLCKSRYCLPTDTAACRGDCVVQAVQKMPADACAEDVNYLACRLWSIDPENADVGKLFCQSYRQRYFPSRIMHYNLNMLRSMKPQALYFANGDILLAPMKMMQEALRLRTDVTVIPLPYLHSDGYMKALCRRLGIQPPSIDAQDYGSHGDDWAKHFEADIIRYLIEQTGRPAYFSTDILMHTALDKDSIYNEGLLLRYSPKPYNNFDVAMHNVREVYNLQYLSEPDLVFDGWDGSQRLDLNCVTLLSHLVQKFRKRGESDLAERLKSTLKAVIERNRIFADEASRQAYMEDFEKETGK